MKILHANDSYTAQGGVEQYILSVTRLLADNGHENVILYTRQQPCTIEDGDWPAYYVPVGEVDVAAQVRKVVDAEQPDITYIHHVSAPDLISALASNLPAVAYVHGFAAVCPGLAKYFRRTGRVCGRPFGWGCFPMHYLRRCSAARHPVTLRRLMIQTAGLKKALQEVPQLLVGTEYMGALLRQNGFAADRIKILPPHFFSNESVFLHATPGEPRLILFAGRLEIEKGFPYLLEAFQKVHPPARLLVAGDGTLRPAYERRVSEMGLDGQVTFLGWQGPAQMQALFRRCALVAMPSLSPESFGKVGVEALAYGRPVVAFDVGGISSWLEDGVSGYLVPPANWRVLAGRIAGLLNDPEKCAAMGRAGQQQGKARFTAKRHLEQLGLVLQQVRNGNG